jgi:translocation and assembly module TamA
VAAFVIAQLSGSAYFDLAQPGRTVLALRGVTGVISGADRFDVPPDQRFYAGGSGTVRGYRYQSLGPQFARNKPQGGQSLAAATVELRQRIGEDFGAAFFADAGQVGTDSGPFSGRFRIGLGVGVRYYTAIGPIRVDVAAPLNRPRGGDIGQFYVGLGQAF